MLSLLFAIAATTKLPLVEVPATHGTSDTLVVFVSGDGGWAAIDKAISRDLAANGMPVVGLNALEYFWTKRTPESAARDLQQIVEMYLAKWGKARVLYAGYSRGADVLPAMINRLPAELRAKTRATVLLGPSPRVEFEFHLGDWMRSTSRSGVAVRPEVDRLKDVICIYGEDDRDSLCPELEGTRVNVIRLKGAHHFDGGYDRLADIIVRNLP